MQDKRKKGLAIDVENQALALESAIKEAEAEGLVCSVFYNASRAKSAKAEDKVRVYVYEHIKYSSDIIDTDNGASKSQREEQSAKDENLESFLKALQRALTQVVKGTD